jgi:hypothetical protein
LGENGLDFSRSALRFNTQAQKDITQIFETMKDFGLRKGDRSAVGIDNLKQALGDLYTPSGQARAFVQSVKDTTRKVLSGIKGYDELSKNYGQKSDLIDELVKGLSLGDKTSVDTSFRKLTSALRQNNEFRQELIQELDKATGGSLLPKIAGQQLSSWTPRGLAGTVAGVGGTAGAVTGNFLPVIKALALSSPRLVGELTNILGISARKGKLLIDFLTGNGAKFNAPGDMLLGKLRGKAEQNIANYVKEPKLGLGIKKVGSMSIDDIVSRELAKADLSSPTINGQIDLSHSETLFRLNQLKSKLESKALNRSEINEALGLLNKIGIKINP